MPSSMLTSRIFAPPSTWSRATASAASKSPLLINRANFFEPVILVRSPIMMKLVSGRIEQRLHAAISGPVRYVGNRARPHAFDRPADRGDPFRCCAAAPADDVQPAVCANSPRMAAVLSRSPRKPPNPSGMPALG